MIDVMVRQILYFILVFYTNFLGCLTIQESPVTEKEVSVGSMISIKLNHPRSKKVLKSLMPGWMVSIHNDTIFEGVPTMSDVGVHVIPELNLAVRVKPEVNPFELCSNRLSPTGVLVAIDAEPSHLSAHDRVHLLHSFASHLQLSHRTLLKFLSSSASTTLQTYLYRLASGPGDVPAVKRSSKGGFIAWRVGCGAIPASGLDMLQRMEKSAVTGELHRVIGYPVLHWLVGDDHTHSMMLRRRRLLLRRKRTPILESTSSGPGNAEEEVGSGLSPIGGVMEGSGAGAEKPGTKIPQKATVISTVLVGATTRSPAITSKIPSIESGKGSNSSGGVTTLTGIVSPLSSRVGQLKTFAPSTSLPSTTTPIPTTTPDSIPVIVHELKRIVVAVGDQLFFNIPRSAFSDKEDGSDKLRILVFKEDGNTPLASYPNDWISYDKETVQLKVSRVTESRIGTHKFVVCAFDKKDNKICGPQIIEVRNTRFESNFDVHKGEYFRKFIVEGEIDYLEKKLNSKSFTLRVAPEAPDWIKINTTDRKILGVVPRSWPTTTINFKLIASHGDKRTALMYGIGIKYSRMNGVTHKIQMILRIPQKIRNQSDLSIEFAIRICEATGMPIEKFMLMNVNVYPDFDDRSRYRRSTSSRNATITWTNRGIISLTQCREAEVRDYVKQMVDFELATGTLIYQKEFKNKMKPFKLHEPLKVDGYGACLGRSFLPVLSTTTTTTTTTTTVATTTTQTTTTTTPKPTPPLIPPGSSLTSLSVFTGLAFRSRLKLNKVDMDPKIFNVIFTSVEKKTPSSAPSDQVTIPRSSWIQLREEDLTLYGLPLKRAAGTSAFSLTILHKNGTTMPAVLPLNVTVVEDERQHLVNNLVRMELRKYKEEKTTESFRKPVLYALKFRLDLVRLLGKHLEGSSCAGSSCEKNIAIQQMSVDFEGNLVFEWSWRALYESSKCDEKKLKRLNGRLLAWNGQARVVLDELRIALKKLNLVATSVNVMARGSCRMFGSKKNTTPSTVRNPPFTRRPVQGSPFGGMIPNFLVVAVIPICAFLILVLVVALIVACCLHHKRKMHMRRRRGIDKPKRAVVFEEEMDEHPNHASKPLILPNEKPPLPPPDYATEIMAPPLLGHEEHIPLTTTSPYRHATNGGSTFRPDQPPMINT